ncbi:MAG TPA: hypothetical protein VF712_18685 [Thermoleophilaceae bacterium]|jgi:DnaJ-class molecular chaperone
MLSTSGQPAAAKSQSVVLGIRCDECGGEGSIPSGPANAYARRCPICRGEGELVTAVLTLEQFRALVV